MLKINRSILIICIVSLFLIIGQISASDTDSIEINDAANNDLILNDAANNDLILNQLNDSDMDNLESDEMEKTAQTETETIDEIVEEKQKETTGVVMANDNYSCGPASLATALNRNGLNLSLNEVSKHTNTSLNGTSMQSLIGLKENNIVHLNLKGCEHWTVISKVTDTHIFLADSTEGNINFTIDEFDSYFSKKAIILSNNSLNDLKSDLISNKITILNKDQCLKISGKGLKKKVVGYRIVWKYGWRQKYGWILRPKVVGGHVSFTQWVYVKGYHAVWGKYKVKEPIYKYYFVSDDAMTSTKIKK